MGEAAAGRRGTRGQTATEGHELRRAISRPMLVIFIIGDILGTGIYALVGDVGGRVGGAIWTSFLVAMSIAFITAFSYAELVTKYPHAAGAALYVNRAFRMPFVTFLVAFAVVLSGLTSASAAGVAFGGDYLAEFAEFPTTWVAIGFILILSVINFIGIKESVGFNMVFTAIELTGLLIILVVGFITLVGGTGDPSRAVQFNESGFGLSLSILGGAALAFFAMVGFEDSVNVAEETHHPERNYPRALFIGVIVTGVVYILVTFTSTMVVPTGQLAGSSAPLLEVVKVSEFPIPPALFSVIALTAVTNSALINLIMGSRLMYGISKQGLIPGLFQRVHPSRRTPVASIVFIALIGVVLVSTANVESLGSQTAALLLAVFALVNICVLVLRRETVDHVHFVAPTVLPVIASISCLILLTKQPLNVVLRALILLGIGVVLFVVNRLISGRVETVEPTELKG